MSARDTPPSSATIAEGNALVTVVRKAHEKSNISRDVGSERARDMLKLETRMEGVARGAGARKASQSRDLRRVRREGAGKGLANSVSS